MTIQLNWPQGRRQWCDASVRSPPECDVLICPRCGDSYMHHGRVTVYRRKRGKEDAAQLIKTTVGSGVRVQTVRARGSRNPSSRRGGLLIGFWCEGCDARPELSIEQSAGQTFFRWRSINTSRFRNNSKTTDDRFPRDEENEKENGRPTAPAETPTTNRQIDEGADRVIR